MSSCRRRKTQRGNSPDAQRLHEQNLLRTFACAVLIVVAGALVYGSGVHGTWVFDDFPAIKDNVHIQKISGVWQAAFGLPQSPLSRRPLVALSVALNYAWGGYNVVGYHVVNLAAHLASALLLFAVVRRICEGPVLRQRVGRHSNGLALAIAVGWMVHPLQSEAVMYITQRTTLFESMFMLATVYCSLRAWQSADSRLWLGLAVASCALSMMSKESAIVIPLLVPLVDVSFFASSWRDAWAKRRKLYGSLAACELLLALFFAIGPDSASIGFDTGITAWQYLLTEAGVLLHYLKLAVWPHPLCLAYDWTPVQAWTEAIVPGIAVLVLLAATVALLFKRPTWGFFGALFFLLLGPTSSFVPIATELVAERRMYLASLAVMAPALGGLLLLVQWSVRQWPIRVSAGWCFALPLAILLAPLVWQTRARVADFRDELTIWSVTVAQCPDNPVSQNNLAAALSESGHFTEAIEHCRQALLLHPNPMESEAHNNLGAAWFSLGDLAVARREFELALKIDPGNAKAHSNLALELVTEGRFAEAEEQSRRSLELDPYHANGHLNRGVALCRLHRIDEAVKEYRLALDLEPQNFLAHFNLGLAFSDLGRSAEAVRELETAVRLNSRDVKFRTKLAELLAAESRVVEAKKHLHVARQLDPQDLSVREMLRRLDNRLANE